MNIACRLIAIGRVQGVGFRYSAQGRASSLGLTGYVRNLRDGSVEMICEGPQDRVDRFILWAAEGPPGSRVGELKKQFIPLRGTYRRFSVEY